MLSKVHDLTEMQGIPIGVIDRLTPKVRVIHARLWALIGLITIATVLGWIIGSVEPAYATAHIWVRVVAVICLALILLVTLVEALYLPMLHSDYSTFRMRIIRDYRDDVERENLLKRLLKE
jgi:K+ transporter